MSLSKLLGGRVKEIISSEKNSSMGGRRPRFAAASGASRAASAATQRRPSGYKLIRYISSADSGGFGRRAELRLPVV
eukprot:1784337-Alexandrium_andersonii.AAC.1